MLPLSSPSQRLALIRRRKKCTRDEIFSDLMQSSRTERAQQNAWRQTMAETRKALNERNERREECDERREERDERRQDAMLSLMGEQTDMLRHLVELQERQQEHRSPLQPLYNHLPSSPSSISSSPRCPRMRGGRWLQAPSHSTPEDCPSNRRLAFSNSGQDPEDRYRNQELEMEQEILLDDGQQAQGGDDDAEWPEGIYYEGKSAGGVEEVNLSMTLGRMQRRQIKELCTSYAPMFSAIPGLTEQAYHSIDTELQEEIPVRVSP
ncbi:uncharacterized protein LOC141987254 [Natator depressus]|uniref:uncharacterized protein LOC141987254 n=1 Tax=Natator depressus TaxID=27790 RepID=UPI003EB7D79E